MNNMFDDESINIDEYNTDSRGVELAKKYLLSRRIVLLYCLASLFLVYYWFIKKDFFGLYLVKAAYVYIALEILVLSSGILALINNHFSKKHNDFSDQEKFDFNYFLYYKAKLKTKFLKNRLLVHMAMNCALMGDKAKCREALSLVTGNYQPNALKILQEWLDSEEASIDREKLLAEKKKPQGVRLLFAYVIVIIALMVACIDYTMLIAYGFSKTTILLLGILQAMGFGIIFMSIVISICMFVKRNKSLDLQAPINKPLKLIIAIVIAIAVVFSNDALWYGLSSDETEVSDEYETDAYDYSDSYEEYSDYSEDEYYEDSYPTELDIMNKMIVLCNYLQKDGVIDDFAVELGYTAKGYVKGTVAQDDDYVYILYDNGTKDDDNGNSCIELVLEAEPLDENGNSLGQSEAKLMGFYLVNLETDEVIDEHKTHW
ncbi:hypothetical protein SAMN04487830_12744 [Pseudobutyrivibrio sp. OR37]|uniref:hypothetical protein n=1 Tax=Pseudobutyrivibrio sp. OR37 TaxID=1798186 RepID=UPI0008F2ABB6|nr:hypothetical protein [Pseudobutyrivibrio sp. OR37]SFI17464.1 hypothetical protein SAMN04487830_12744 [Pseudobutyrivibrio sp. OR37]